MSMAGKIARGILAVLAAIGPSFLAFFYSAILLSFLFRVDNPLMYYPTRIYVLAGAFSLLIFVLLTVRLYRRFLPKLRA